MDKEIVQAIIQMIQAGGQMAIWGIVAYWGMNLLTIAVKGGILWSLAKVFTNLITHCWDNYQTNKDKRIGILSDQASSQLLSALKEYQEKVNGILQDITRQLGDLETKLNTTSNK